MRLARPPDQDDDVQYEWYWPVGAAAFAVALALGVTAQRGGLVSPNAGALWAGVAVLPWLFDAVMFPLRRAGSPVWLFTVVVVGATVAIETDPVDVDIAPFFLVLLTGEMACRLKIRGSIAVALVSMGAMLGVDVWGEYEESYIWLLAIALCWAGGIGMQAQLRLLAKVREEQAGLAQRAAADERQRIAREIHDVIAHSLAVTMLHLTGARLALRRDPEEAETALIEAERLGRESLAEIRRTVGLLAPEGTGTGAPMPTAADIPELVREFEAAGLDVAFELTGDPHSLPPAAGLALYRVVQESLSNVVRHARGAPTSLSLVADRDVARLQVRNRLAQTVGAPTVDGGLGVRGMQERVKLLGGELRAGPDEQGWCVDVELPLALETT